MDWSKAKSILILLFLTLNIFLIVYISAYKLGQGVSRETLADAREILYSRNVKLECEIPAYNSETSRLIYENGRFDRSKIAELLLGSVYQLSEKDGKDSELADGSKKLVFKGSDLFVFTDGKPSGQLDISDKDEVEKQLRELLTGMGMQMSAYKLDWFYKNSDGSAAFVFTEKHRQFLVFDNYARVTVENGGISYLECRYKKVKSLSKEMTRIMPAYKILLKNFGSSESAAITIIDIDIGFKGYNPEKDAKQYSEGPAWRIMMENGTARYFKAYDGEEIK